MASGRGAHDDKVTFYCNTDELVRLQNAVTALRARGVRVDRGRFIREALAYVLDLDELDWGTFEERLAQPLMNLSIDS